PINAIAPYSRRHRELWIPPSPQVSSPESVGYYTETIGGQATRSLLYLVNLPFLISVPHCHLFLFFLSTFLFLVGTSLP
ncbi:unnamed protein product, partial [Ascophyllum nodosum]